MNECANVGHIDMRPDCMNAFLVGRAGDGPSYVQVIQKYIGDASQESNNDGFIELVLVEAEARYLHAFGLLFQRRLA